MEVPDVRYRESAGIRGSAVAFTLGCIVGGTMVAVVLFTRVPPTVNVHVEVPPVHVEVPPFSNEWKSASVNPGPLATSNKGCSHETLNVLTGKAYPHHPVMLEVDLNAYPVEKGYITELNGIKVPAGFDCDIFNDGKPWGNHYYFYEVPTRWFACYELQAELSSGMLSTQPRLPFVDDEYIEQTAVYQSVLRAKSDQPYVFMELGARWGTWGSRAIGLWRSKRPDQPYRLYLIEANKENCKGLRATMEKNEIHYTLACEFANKDKMEELINSEDHIDLIDFDIQGGEHVLIPQIMDLINAKVYRVIIGTHDGHQKHEQMKQLFEGGDEPWIKIWEMPHASQQQFQCVNTHIRRGYDPNRWTWESFQWGKMAANPKCYTKTPYGPVANADGELIYDNPRFVRRHGAFSMEDTELKINDLW